MAKIQLNEFKGIMPKVSNDKLPINMAQVASDIKTASGAAVAYRRPTPGFELPGTAYKTFFEYLEGGNNHWVYYDAIVHWVRSPIANDEFERMYTTGSETKYKAFVNDLQGVGTFDFSTDFYYPGAPVGAAPGLSYTGGGTDYRAYFYTYVSRYGEEGPASLIGETTVTAAQAGDWDGTSSIVIGPFPEPAAADEHLKTVVGSNAPALRIYRTSTAGDGSTAFLLVAEIAVDNTGPASTAWATYTYTDTDDAGDDALLGSTCPSVFYDRAPDGLSGLRGHPNGFFVAFKDNVLYFTDPFAPWAWPEDYQIPIDQKIIGVGIYASSIVVLTDGYVYTFSGPHPTSLYKTKLSFQPCLSQRAIVETDEGVMFPSLEGFHVVSGSGMQNVTKDLFKPEDWVNFELETMHGTWYNKAYYGFYSSQDYDGHIIIDFLNGSITTGDLYHKAGHVALLDGTFRTILDSDITDPGVYYISLWDSDETKYWNYSYKSPRFILEKPHNFKVAQVILDSDFFNEVIGDIADQDVLEDLNADAWIATDWGVEDLESSVNGFSLGEQDVNGDVLYGYSQIGVQGYVDFNIFVDGELIFSRQVSSSSMFKLPKGFKNKKWEIQIEGMIPVKRITMATSTEEIV